ncbi:MULTISPECIES: hypothetical protein [unclassified Luteococcus]|uniref:hypothetical protein n=1 Tax=unclassified Luteococcus TaxID=2639923 RepID=UPI00313D4104
MQILPLGPDWPDWAVVIKDTTPAEAILPRVQIVVMRAPITPQWAVAHARAHLELGHHLQSGPITDDQEQWARMLAWTIRDDEPPLAVA